MPRPRLLVASLLAATLAAAGPAVAGSGTVATGGIVGVGAPGDPEVLNVVPPGSRGNVTFAQLAELGVTNLPDFDPSDPMGSLATATPTAPANYADQLEMYDALGRATPGTLADGDLTKYYKNAGLGVRPQDVVSVEQPRPGVTITRDTWGVPHIKGQSYEDVTFGAGYANIQDRMFLTDILRHTGAARMSEFVGPSPGNLAMDREQLRIAAYTPEEAERQILANATRYGAEGERLIKGLDAFLDGMNAAQRALCPLAFQNPLPGDTGAGFGPDCPVEYAALQKPPTPYTRADVVYIASLVGGIFGKGGGGEYANAVWLQQLQRKFGDAEGRRVYDDLREKNDAEAPTTSPVPLPLYDGGVDPDRPGVALPDLDAPTAPGTGADAGGSTVPLPPLGLPAAAQRSPGFGVVDGPFGPIDLGLRPHGMSNALLVSAEHTKSGHPVVVFGPQTGYYAPQLLVEQELEGPGVHARGVSFAGTNLVVELGRGVDYAWSATSSSDDVVDTVMERLCNLDGSAPTVESTAYLDATGTCVPMDRYVHEMTAVPNAASQNPPAQIRLDVWRTRHGIVQLRTTAAGVPVAVVQQRSTYGHEVDSAVGFARVNNPDFVHDAASFMKAFEAVDYTFNWFYVDDHDIAYFNSALLPRRASGVDWDLPRWGDAAYDWQGFHPFRDHPRVVNPASGYIVSWNNKQAPGFAAADNVWGYGSVYRSELFSDRIAAAIRAGVKVTRADVVSMTLDASTVDLRAADVLPAVLDVIGSEGLSGADADAVHALREWLADGAQRVDRDRDGTYAHQAAIALLDAWWDPQAADVGGDFSLPKDAMRATLEELVDQLPMGLDDHPRQHTGSAWNEVAWYGYLDKDLRALLGRPVADRYSRGYCGAGSLEDCREQLRASLHAAVSAVLAAQKVDEVSALTYDKHRDDITHTAAGVVGVRPIDWQNRPTFQQVVSFRSDRHEQGGPVVTPVQGGALPVQVAAPRPAVRDGRLLADTGQTPVLPAGGAVLLLAAVTLLALRRRRPGVPA